VPLEAGVHDVVEHDRAALEVLRNGTFGRTALLHLMERSATPMSRCGGGSGPARDRVDGDAEHALTNARAVM
jgi:hypothetical protein